MTARRRPNTHLCPRLSRLARPPWAMAAASPSLPLTTITSFSLRHRHIRWRRRGAPRNASHHRPGRERQVAGPGYPCRLYRRPSRPRHRTTPRSVARCRPSRQRQVASPGSPSHHCRQLGQRRVAPRNASRHRVGHVGLPHSWGAAVARACGCVMIIMTREPPNRVRNCGGRAWAAWVTCFEHSAERLLPPHTPRSPLLPSPVSRRPITCVGLAA